jgi:hypothetical protein
MADPLSFEETTADDYAQKFVDTCKPTNTRRGVRLKGPCPRCADDMEFDLITGVFLSEGPGRSDDWLPVMCTCRSLHPGRPSGDEGCGAYWNVTRPTT